MAQDIERFGIDRRSFLRRSAVGAAGVAVLGSAGASTLMSGLTAMPAGAQKKDLGTLDFQLSWVKNVEFAGEYWADSKGFYKDEGFSSVNLMAGGANVQQDAIVASGKAFIGISAPDITASAINNGAEIIIIGAQYQKNPFAVMSLAKSKIKTPEDMIGKKIGVQATNEPVWAAFLKANNIDPSKINKVPGGFDPQPLVNGEVDGWFSFFTNEPNVLKSQGVKNHFFLLADYGYPLVSETYMVAKESLTKDRDKVKAVLRADIKGWHENFKDPKGGAKLAANVYGKDLKLDVAEQTLESKAENSVILTDETYANGLFTITPALIQENIDTLGDAGITITAPKLFDMSVLAEVYSENPELKKSPVEPT